MLVYDCIESDVGSYNCLVSTSTSFPELAIPRCSSVGAERATLGAADRRLALFPTSSTLQCSEKRKLPLNYKALATIFFRISPNDLRNTL